MEMVLKLLQRSKAVSYTHLCATQYSSEYMDVEIRRDGMLYTLHFKKGEIDGQMEKQPYKGNRTGTKIRWKPDLDVFTDIDVPAAWFQEIMKRQAVVNAGLTLHLKYQDVYKRQVWVRTVSAVFPFIPWRRTGWTPH